MQTLLDAIQSNETHRKPNGLKQRIQRILYSLKLIDPPKHLINTIPDEADLPGVCQIWFNEEIQIPIWTDDKGLVCAFRIYLEKKLRENALSPFLEWSAKFGYASSESPPTVRWARRQFRKGSIGGFAQMQEWGDLIAKVLKGWPSRWDRTLDMSDKAARLTE
jgi:hypothetical protein